MGDDCVRFVSGISVIGGICRRDEEDVSETS